MLKKTSAVILVAVLSIAALAEVWILVNGTDAPPSDDSDLLVPWVEVPDEENAYPDLVAAAEAISVSEEDRSAFWGLASGRQWDPELAARLLQGKDSVAALEHLERALAKGTLHVDGDTPLPALLDVAGLVRIRAVAASKAGDTNEIIEAIATARRLGQMMQPAGALVWWLIGHGIEDRALEDLVRVLPELRISRSESLDLLATLSEHETADANLARALRGEYTSLANHLDKTAAEIRPDWTSLIGLDRYVIQPNETKSLFARSNRAVLAHAAEPCASALEGETDDRPSGLIPPIPGPESILRATSLKQLLTPNQLGRALHDIALPSITRSLQTKCESRTLLAATRLIIALKSYENEQGALPERLDQLVPTYFENLPRSDNDGQPFQYSASNRTLNDSHRTFEIAP